MTRTRGLRVRPGRPTGPARGTMTDSDSERPPRPLCTAADSDSCTHAEIMVKKKMFSLVRRQLACLRCRRPGFPHASNGDGPRRPARAAPGDQAAAGPANAATRPLASKPAATASGVCTTAAATACAAATASGVCNTAAASGPPLPVPPPRPAAFASCQRHRHGPARGTPNRVGGRTGPAATCEISATLPRRAGPPLTRPARERSRTCTVTDSDQADRECLVTGGSKPLRRARSGPRRRRLRHQKQAGKWGEGRGGGVAQQNQYALGQGRGARRRGACGADFARGREARGRGAYFCAPANPVDGRPRRQGRDGRWREEAVVRRNGRWRRCP